MMRQRDSKSAVISLQIIMSKCFILSAVLNGFLSDTAELASELLPRSRRFRPTHGAVSIQIISQFHCKPWELPSMPAQTESSSQSMSQNT
jgi:hypothetical protein